MTKQLPPVPDLSRRATEYQLGEFIRLYPTYRDGLKSNIMSLLGGLVFVGFGIFALIAELDLDWWVIATVMLFGVLLTVWGTHSFVTQLPIKVQVHQGGFVYKRLGGVDVVPYREVLGVHVDVTTTTMSDSGASHRSGKIHAHLPNGVVKVNPNIEHVGQFINTFLEGAAEPVLHNLQTHLRSGKEFDCGPFKLTPQGVQVKENTMHYSSDLSAWVDSSHVKIEGKKGAIVRFRRSKVINAAYLAEFLLRMSPDQRRVQVMLG